MLRKSLRSFRSATKTVRRLKYHPIYLYIKSFGGGYSKEQFSEELDTWYKILPVDPLYSDKEWLRFANLFHQVKEYRSLLYFRIGRRRLFMPLLFPPQAACVINPTKIGKNLVLQHAHSTEINCESMGDNCQVWQNVTIGVAKSRGPKPRIGNNVRICAGAIVIGGITIGDNATVGAGSVVVKDVPANTTVVGNPAHPIEKDRSQRM